MLLKFSIYQMIISKYLIIYKNPTAANSRTAVNSRSSAFTVLNFNTKGAIYGTN